MADLIVTFARARSKKTLGEDTTLFPVAKGSGCRTEAISIIAEGDVTSMSAESGEQYVSLKAKAECWVAVGSDPTAAAVSSADSPPAPQAVWHMDADERLDLSIETGDKVAVIAA